MNLQKKSPKSGTNVWSFKQSAGDEAPTAKASDKVPDIWLQKIKVSDKVPEI